MTSRCHRKLSWNGTLQYPRKGKKDRWELDWRNSVLDFSYITSLFLFCSSCPFLITILLADWFTRFKSFSYLFGTCTYGATPWRQVDLSSYSTPSPTLLFLLLAVMEKHLKRKADRKLCYKDCVQYFGMISCLMGTFIGLTYSIRLKSIFRFIWNVLYLMTPCRYATLFYFLLFLLFGFFFLFYKLKNDSPPFLGLFLGSKGGGGGGGEKGDLRAKGGCRHPLFDLWPL